MGYPKDINLSKIILKIDQKHILKDFEIEF